MVIVKEEWCKSCGLCITNCNKGAISQSGRFNKSGYEFVEVDTEKCVSCGICYTVCPDWVFEILADEKGAGE